MGLLFFVFSFVFLGENNCQQKEMADVFENCFPNVEELSISSENCILEDRHLWVSNEIQTVNPDFKGIGGITKIYSPPLNLSPLQMDVKFFERKIKTKQYNWKPGEIIQQAEINGIEIKCLIIPLSSSTKVIQVYELSNQNKESIAIPIQISVAPYLSNYDSLWIWSPRDAKNKATLEYTPKISELLFKSEDGIIKISTDNNNFEKKENYLSGSIDIEAGEKKQFTTIISYSEKNQKDEITSKGTMQLIQEARERWNERLTYAYNHLGRIKSSNADLDLFYKRGILSLLTCEWNKKELLLQPYFSESGID
ncbi:MAG: hypothetical protein KDC97_10000, partial [Confluentibacter sp.]|nr:hypothetical protein [Confluentibacter sp.]